MVYALMDEVIQVALRLSTMMLLLLHTTARSTAGHAIEVLTRTHQEVRVTTVSGETEEEFWSVITSRANARR